MPTRVHLTEATVERYLANVYRKAGVRSRNEAMRKALTGQWVGIHEITSPDADGSDGFAGSPRG
jgi:hypothetical protein